MQTLETMRSLGLLTREQYLEITAYVLVNSSPEQILAMPAVQERFGTLGLRPVGNTPAAARTFVQGEIDKWAKFVQVSGAKVD